MAFINYENKVCIVTGSSSGIGFETAKSLLEYKAIVYGLDTIPTQLEGINYIECDLTSKESIDNAFEKIPNHIDSFFGNAAISGIRSDFTSTYITVFVANKYICEEYLKKRMTTNGSIAFVNSFLGNYWEKYSSEFKEIMSIDNWDKMVEYVKSQDNNDLSGIKAYPLAKRALNYYMANLSLSLGKNGIRVNSVVPGTTDTKMINDFRNSNGELNDIVCQIGVANRLARPDEIANVLVFINSNLATYINGICLPVDYGNNTQFILGQKADKFDMKINSTLFGFGTDLMLSNSIFKNEAINDDEEII